MQNIKLSSFSRLLQMACFVDSVDNSLSEFLHCWPPTKHSMKLIAFYKGTGSTSSYQTRGWKRVVILKEFNRRVLSNQESYFQRFSLQKLSICYYNRIQFDEINQTQKQLQYLYYIPFPLYKTIKFIIITANKTMNPLPIIIASKQLSLSLSTNKVKTLVEAEQFNKNASNFKIQTVLQEYQKTKLLAESVLFGQQNLGLTESIYRQFQKDPISYYLQCPSIIEIMGLKGSGKTALVLRLALQFMMINRQRKLYILNCAGGITHHRISRFSKINLSYADIFRVEDLLEMLGLIKKDKSRGLIVIDSVANLLLGSDKQKLGLGEVLISLRNAGWSVYFTNYIQGRQELDQKDMINSMTYFPHIFGGISSCKFTIEPCESMDNRFKIRMIKSLNSKYFEFQSQMNQYGLEDIILHEMN